MKMFLMFVSVLLMSLCWKWCVLFILMVMVGVLFVDDLVWSILLDLELLMMMCELKVLVRCVIVGLDILVWMWSMLVCFCVEVWKLMLRL